MHLVHQLIFHENRSQQVGNSTAKRPQIMSCWWWWWWCVWVIFKHSFHLFSDSSGWLGATLCVVIRRDFLAMHHFSFEHTVCAPHPTTGSDLTPCTLLLARCAAQASAGARRLGLLTSLARGCSGYQRNVKSSRWFHASRQTGFPVKL